MYIEYLKLYNKMNQSTNEQEIYCWATCMYLVYWYMYISVYDLPCTDDIPTCGDTCGKLMSCGLHSCVQRCHNGPCGSVCTQSFHFLFCLYTFSWLLQSQSANRNWHAFIICKVLVLKGKSKNLAENKTNHKKSFRWL